MTASIIATATNKAFQAHSVTLDITHGFSLVNGDYVLLFFSEGSSDPGAIVCNSGGAFTEAVIESQPGGPDRRSKAMYRKVTDAGSEPSIYAIDTSAGAGGNFHMVGRALQIRGADATTFLDVAATKNNSDSGDFTPDNVDITTANDDALVIIMHHANAAAADTDMSAKTPGAPSGFNLEGSNFSYDGVNNYSVLQEIASDVQVLQGTSAPGVWTGTPDDAVSAYITFAIAIRSAAGGVSIPVLNQQDQVPERHVEVVGYKTRLQQRWKRRRGVMVPVWV